MQKVLEEALSELANLESEEVFLLKDLFKGYQWSRMTAQKRRSLGSLFLITVNTDDYRDKVEILEKTSSNQQRYKKV